MKESIAIASARILAPAEIENSGLERVMAQLVSTNIDDADLYFQSRHFESWFLEDRIVREGSFNIDCGVGIRAVSGEKTGFAYSDIIAQPTLMECARTARAISRGGQTQKIAITNAVKQQHHLFPTNSPLATLTSQQKIDALKLLDQVARAVDPRVSQVMVNMIAVHEVVLIVAHDGTRSCDIRPMVRVSVNVIAEQDGRREQGNSGGGGRTDYSYLMSDDRAVGFAKEAARQALVNLEAENAPAGEMAVVLGPGWPGILLHEAVGHGLEGDFNRKKTSAFSGKIGEQVASKLCTVIDNGALDKRRGSLNVDDEGTLTQSTTLIENGILKGYMQDRLNARLMGMATTGNGRRESYADLPLPRMTNTYLMAGKSDPQEIIESVDYGLYAVNFGGGQVDITSGKFVFTASEAYLIKGGKICHPVRGATLIGNGPEALQHVSMVGNDLAFDEGVGMCGKEGQTVPVTVGQPTVKVDALTVGGTDL